jgi:hypothetical protein
LPDHAGTPHTRQIATTRHSKPRPGPVTHRDPPQNSRKSRIS